MPQYQIQAIETTREPTMINSILTSTHYESLKETNIDVDQVNSQQDIHFNLLDTFIIY